MSGEQRASGGRRATILPPQPEQLRDDEVEEIDPSAAEVLQVVMSRFDDFELRIDNRLSSFHAELSLLRQHVLGSQEPRLQATASKVTDHEPRLAEVEKRTLAQRVGGGAATGIRWGGVATLVLTAAAQVAAELRPGAVGPIQALIKLFGGE